MRVAAYSIKEFEKELLEKENMNKHELQYFSDPLSTTTAVKAKTCDAVMVFTNDEVSAPVINILSDQGIKYITTRSVGTDHIDLNEAKKRNIKVANVPAYSPEAVAEHAVMLSLALARKLIPTVDQSRAFNFSIENHMGFNLNKKTVGIIGLGSIGRAASSIFAGFGCRIMGYDISFPKNIQGVEEKSLNTLFSEADIISLHLPLTAETRYIINKENIAKMKNGAMLINTGRGALMDTEAVIAGLESGKIGYLGMDVYEYEKACFFSDHHLDKNKDPLLSKLMASDNVIVTPHQAFLTREAVTEIARSTINNLNQWERGEM